MKKQLLSIILAFSLFSCEISVNDNTITPTNRDESNYIYSNPQGYIIEYFERKDYNKIANYTILKDYQDELKKTYKDLSFDKLVYFNPFDYNSFHKSTLIDWYIGVSGTKNTTVFGKATDTEDRNNKISAAYFDGKSNYNFSGTEKFKFEDFSFSFWVNPDDMDEPQPVFSFGASKVVQSVYFITLNDILYLTFESAGQKIQYKIDKPADFVKTWKHIVVTRSVETINLYIDGKLATNKTFVSTYPKYAKSGNNDFNLLILGTSDLFIGSKTTSFRGKLDEFLWYGKALSEAEVANLFKIVKI